MLLLSGPNMAGNEWKYVKDCLDTGWVSSVGAYVDQFEKMSAEFAGTKYAVATSSGTTALHICLIMLGVNEKDYVITPNITFIATCNSIKYTGANPILVDTDPGSWQMDLDLLEEFLSTQDRTTQRGMSLQKRWPQNSRHYARACAGQHVRYGQADGIGQTA
ncbi:MAG: aminotransferase class I/II-fold pyridoxal phosphate-dependent enzyme [Chitinophagaceae bacterium]|nr:aminotransferase class I/II-fold pyridoxal phosphate-dependent enzyme [Chitinophagaceae bacterium]